MGLHRREDTAPLREVRRRQYPRDLAGLTEQLRHGTADERRHAARDLAQHPEVATLLGMRLLVEGDSSVREALFGSLTDIGSAEAVAALLPLLRVEDAALRNAAIEALSALPQQTGPYIDTLLRDTDSDVRIFAVNLLADLRHERVTEWLTHALRHDENVNVVAAAIEVMAETGEPHHVSALSAARERFAADPFIGFAADLAIERIQAP